MNAHARQELAGWRGDVFLIAQTTGVPRSGSIEGHESLCADDSGKNADLFDTASTHAFSFTQRLRPLLTLIAPSDCRLCGDPLRTCTNYPVCAECIAELRDKPLVAACARCGEPVAPESARMAGLSNYDSHECAVCAAEPALFTRATAFGLYADHRSAIHLMKFEGVPSLAKPLGLLLANAIRKHLPDAPHDMLVIPVPLYRRKRTFNQSTLLARSALDSLRRTAPYLKLTLQTDLLHRVRRTESQFLLTHTQRKDNVRGAFEASVRVRGRDVLLIDDVYTTGATCIECTRVLLKAGAASVRVATLARAGHDYAVAWRPAGCEKAQNIKSLPVSRSVSGVV